MTTTISSPQKLYLLQLSTSTVQGAGRLLDMVLGCYLIETNDGKHILIDSGFPTALSQSLGKSSIGQETNVIEQLDKLGVRPKDIDILICTHFDVDHVGYHDAFPMAKFIVQRQHYELARSGHPRFAAARAHWDNPALHYHLIDGDTELLPGLTLLETSGHTPGHQSVLVRLPLTGLVLLAIDAVVMQRLFTPDRQTWPMDDNEEQLRASTRKLLRLVEQEHISLVVFGHDGQQWQTLKKSPFYYE